METNIQFIQETDIHKVATYIAEKIQSQLEGGNSVAWFVSGGSNIQLAVAVRNSLALDAVDAKLRIFQVDERYGPIGHTDSNWQQLLDAGFSTDGIEVYPILDGASSLNDAAIRYADIVTKLLESSPYAIAVYGIGADGHTAGLLPDNPLTDASELYGSYSADDYDRITSTSALVPCLDEAVVFAQGKEKESALRSMIDRGPTDTIPARILQRARTLTIISNINMKG